MNRAIFCTILITILLTPMHGLSAADSGLDDRMVKGILQDRVDKAKHGTCIVVGILDEKGSRVVSYGTASGPASAQAGALPY